MASDLRSRYCGRVRLIGFIAALASLACVKTGERPPAQAVAAESLDQLDACNADEVVKAPLVAASGEQFCVHVIEVAKTGQGCKNCACGRSKEDYR